MPNTKLVFLGQSTYFQAIALSKPTEDLKTEFVEYRPGMPAEAAHEALIQAKADVVIAFKPESLPEGLLRGVGGERIGWFTEPIPRNGYKKNGILTQRGKEHLDLERRYQALSRANFDQFDRFISYDFNIVKTLERFVDIWRSIPLPVDDIYFVDEISQRRMDDPRISFWGRPTPYRDRFLNPILHSSDVLYIAHGAFGGIQRDLLSQVDVAINIHNEDYPNFENRVPLHLASGHLVLSEELSPRHGLEPDLDFVEFYTPENLGSAVQKAKESFAEFKLMRIRGREKAEYFRASRVYSEIISSLK